MKNPASLAELYLNAALQEQFLEVPRHGVAQVPGRRLIAMAFRTIGLLETETAASGWQPCANRLIKLSKGQTRDVSHTGLSSPTRTA